MIILSFDPGFINFAWCVSKFTVLTEHAPFKQETISCGHLHNKITKLTNSIELKNEAELFRDEITELIINNEVDTIYMERFQSRGVKSGLTQECVTMMIGILLTIAYKNDCKIELVTPSTWKNSFNKQNDLKLTYSLCWTTPHILDASLIGYYGFCLENNYIPFQYMKNDVTRDNYLFDLEEHAPELHTRKKERYFCARRAD